MTTGRSPARSQAIRIDAVLRGMRADPADGGFAILDTFKRAGLVTTLDPVIGHDADHASRCLGAHLVIIAVVFGEHAIAVCIVSQNG